MVDRDPQSFKENQYDNIINGFNDNNKNIAISNPCFEFYLLLHLTNLSQYDDSIIEKIKRNKRIKKSKSSLKYCEYLLDKEVKLLNMNNSYKKNKYNAQIFIDKLEDLFNHAQQFEQDNQT